MDTVDLAHAKDHLEELVARAANGEDVSITDPVLGTFRLLPVKSPAERKRPILGQWKDRFTVPARLFEPLPEDELAWFWGERPFREGQ
jgi:antitoxin (DNA-binding transcriptional repressor) of toxin-antitoxin stability system